MNLAERFARDNGAPQILDGNLVHNIFKCLVQSGDIVRVRKISSNNLAVHGLRIKLHEGTIEINKQALNDFVIWEDTAPSEVDFICRPKIKTGELRVWNCWRTQDGVTQAWIGNAGLIVEQGENKVKLRCSDGFQDFSPNDFAVEISISRASHSNF